MSLDLNLFNGVIEMKWFKRKTEEKIAESVEKEHFHNLTMNKERFKLFKSNMNPPFHKIRVEVDGNVVVGFDVTEQRSGYIVFMDCYGEILYSECEGRDNEITILEEDGSIVIVMPDFKYEYCRITKNKKEE